MSFGSNLICYDFNKRQLQFKITLLIVQLKELTVTKNIYTKIGYTCIFKSMCHDIIVTKRQWPCSKKASGDSIFFGLFHNCDHISTMTINAASYFWQWSRYKNSSSISFLTIVIFVRLRHYLLDIITPNMRYG